uniref:Putative activating signal cointegrator 1 n=1 Tax=Nyssomyia neivai TaxID=330878 RepID=A0A1L8DH83_9DIPT
MERQVQCALSQILDLNVPEEMIQHILSLGSTNEVDEYFSSLLDYTIEEHKQFVEDFKELRFKPKSKDPKKKGAISKNSVPTREIKSTVDNKSEREKPKKKNKYTNLYNNQGNISEIMLKGRHMCNCQASKHTLINNCLNCGRIVCEQEGVGPCLFCSTIVKRIEDTEYIEDDRKSSKGGKAKGLKDRETAMEQRDRLLGYDRQSEKRTTVIDDESDYFKTHSVWLSDKEREKLKQLEDDLRDRKHANRLRHKYKFDFSGRQILDDTDTIDYDAFQNVDNIEKSMNKMGFEREMEMHLPKIEEYFPELNPNQMNHTKCPNFKVQDKTFIEISDQGFCLSMHQPWASLLVAGIKKHEGRSWYTSHRGRLWIASTAKPPNPEEVKQVEDFYKLYYDDKAMKFPTLYPSGSLLGHVTVDNCLSQEDYAEEHPHGESDSPYVFICTNPIQLPVIFPISGKHKIYKLDSNIHVAAMRSLQKCGRL